MKKKSVIILYVLLTVFSLTACKGRVERIEPKEEVQEENINGYTSEELENSTLPEDVFDEDDAENNDADEASKSEEEFEKDVEDIIKKYQDDGGAIILPEDEL